MRCTLVLLALCAVPTSASAADTRWGLRWRAPDECISAADLAARVEQRLGRSVFGANPDFRVDGVVEQQKQAPKWKARVTVVSAAGDVLGSREVTGNEGCRALDDRLAFVVAVSIEPALALGETPTPKEPAPEPPPGPQPVAPAVVSPVVPAPNPRRASVDSVWVELETDNPRVTLFRHVGTSYGANIVVTTIEKACEAPCKDFIANPKSDFFISGAGVSLSSTFSLSKYQDGLRLKVTPGSAALRFFGWMLATVGTVSALLGGTFGLVQGLTSRPPVPGVQNPYGGTNTTIRDLALAMGIGGGAAIAAGIPMIAFSSTRLEFFPAPAPPALSPASNVTEI